MKKYFGTSVRGWSHLKNNIPNQDTFLIKHLYDFDLMMVLDGVSLDTKGNVSKSEYASNFVKMRVLKYMHKHATYNMSMDDLLKLIEKCFASVNDDLKALAKCYGKRHKCSKLVLDYQTTLAIVIHRDGDFVYGNAGDSGIIFEGKRGLKFITNCIKEGCMASYVEPLVVKDAWQFGKVIDQEVKYILMATDGIFDAIIPVKDNRHYNLSIINQLFRYKNNLKAFLKNSQSVITSDDKTVVILENESYREYLIDEELERKKCEDNYHKALQAIFKSELGV